MHQKSNDAELLIIELTKAYNMSSKKGAKSDESASYTHRHVVGPRLPFPVRVLNHNKSIGSYCFSLIFAELGQIAIGFVFAHKLFRFTYA